MCKQCDPIRPLGTPWSGSWQISRGTWEELNDVDVAVGGTQEAQEHARMPRILRSPLQPTPQEVEMHEATHLPYQPWCKFCVQGKCPNRQHRESKRSDEDKDGVPHVFMDYMYMTSKDQEKMSPILVIKDSKSKSIFAHAVTVKGTKDNWIVKAVTEDLDSLGYGWTKVVIRSDQEPALIDVKNELRRARWKEFDAIIEEVAKSRKANTEVIRKDLGPTTILEESPVAESSSNGTAENAIRHFQGQFRTMKSYLMNKVKEEIAIGHPIWTWLVEWVPITLNRYHMGKDGLTAHQRCVGKTFIKPIAMFGEKVLYRILDNKHNVDKHDARWREGIWLGIIPRTNEDLVGTPQGVVKASAIKRLSADSRWDVEAVRAVVGYPWQPVPSVAGAHIPIVIRKDLTAPGAAEEDSRIEVEMPATVQFEGESAEDEEKESRCNKPEIEAREMKITENIIKKYGTSNGCPGCKKIEEKTGGARIHSRVCRRRIQEDMNKTPDGKRKLEEEEGRKKRYKEIYKALHDKPPEEDRKRSRGDDKQWWPPTVPMSDEAPEDEDHNGRWWNQDEDNELREAKRRSTQASGAQEPEEHQPHPGRNKHSSNELKGSSRQCDA